MPRIRGIAILDFPVIAPSIPTPAPWMVSFSQSITLTSGSAVLPTTTTTQFNLYQPASGTGIPAGAYIVSINPGVSVTLNVPATVSGAQTITFGLANQSQSSNAQLLGSSWQGFPLPPLLTQAGAFADVNGCLLEIPNSQAIPANGTYIIPPGEGMMLLTSGTTAAQYQEFQGTTAPAWTTLISGTVSATVLLPFMSDGANYRINSPTTASTVVFRQWR